ncbi:hypothetical protein CCR75_008352 [Bremia lactucae]|uniref:Replication termination factor 2 n=1 Tax=Bremia lactucae TaxID=4779 RepID=A0A976FF12_BRELC|nr:hypothetical protein CCR75_008352 [Bremia lactucae]
MGNDGGVIAVKRKFMRHANVKVRGETADQKVLRSEKARTCALSSEPLREPVVACRLGNFFNKQTLLEHLIAKSMSERFRHITSIKDVVTCRMAHANDGEKLLWCCPITLTEFNGKQPFVLFFSCGCVVSERALKSVRIEECLVCGKAYHDQDVVSLLLNDELYETKQKKLLELKFNEMRAKKSHRKELECVQKDGELAPKKKCKGKKRKAEHLTEKKDAKLGKIAKDATESIFNSKGKSEVFASLFTTSKNEKVSANDLLMTIGGMRYTLS